MRIHLDTDFGGDPDDACALAMLLGWPDVELVGITTTIDAEGRRAAYVRHCLQLVGRDAIPVAAGAEVSLTTKRRADPFIDERYWPRMQVPHRSPPGAALDLLVQSIEAGATIVGIGPYTNLALLELMHPGALAGAPVVVMGGWVHPPQDGLPAWGPEMDFNAQWDTRAAELVVATANLTLAPLAAAFNAPLRARDIPRLRASGPLGELLTRQSEHYGQDSGMMVLGPAHAGLPDDLLNVQWDPVACAAALGWTGVTIEEKRLRPELEGEVLRFQPDEQGRRMRVVVDVDGLSFSEAWLGAVEAAQHSSGRTRAGSKSSPAVD
jgi:purine nucleosidase